MIWESGVQHLHLMLPDHENRMSDGICLGRLVMVRLMRAPDIFGKQRDAPAGVLSVDRPAAFVENEISAKNHEHAVAWLE